MTTQATFNKANRLFNQVMNKSTMRKLMSFFTRTNHDLLSYGTEHKDVAAQHYCGGQTIAIEQIKGSLSRVEDFDDDFLPKSEIMEERWVRIAIAMLEDKALPAIKVYRIDDIYFVEDGHHRVSVAKALGFLYIDAIVIEIDTQQSEAA